jgi:ABC-type glycerol-3-phosphate transport system substrate-binding protein
MVTTRLTGRALLRSTAAAAALAGAPFVRGAYAAGKLGVATWDHWMPGANDVLQKLAQEWAEKEKVELTIDFVTSQGDKLMLMGAAEAEAHSGHEVIRQPGWYGAAKAECGSRPMT